MSESTRRSLSILGIVAVVVFVYLTVSRAFLLHEAKTLINELRSLDQAQDPTAAALSFTQRHHSHLTRMIRDRGVYYEFLFTNRLLSIPHFATRSEIVVSFSFFQDRLSQVGVDFASYVFRENSPVVHVHEDSASNGCPYFDQCRYLYLNPHGRDVAQTWNGDVGLGQFANEERKRAAWAFNTDCFVAVRGCRDISELMPAVWKRTSPGRVSSRTRSNSDSFADAAQPLPD